MAFVSDEHKLVFIHIPKNGGTSIKQALCQAHGAKLTGQRDFNHAGVGNSIPARLKPNGVNVHDTWEQVVAKCPHVRTYKVLAVHRNPWARILSFYQHKVRRDDPDLLRDKRGRPLSLCDHFRQSNVLLLKPQIWWTQGCTAPMLTMAFDNLHESGIASGLKWAGLPSVDLPHLNRTKEPTDYRQHYDDYTAGLVQAYYQAEIDQYGYTF